MTTNAVTVYGYHRERPSGEQLLLTISVDDLLQNGPGEHLSKLARAGFSITRLAYTA